MYTPITLDKARNVMLGFEALQVFKKITGKSLMKVDFENEDIEELIPTIFYAGLIHEDKELTVEATTKLIDKYLGIKGAIEILPKIMEELAPKENGIKNAQRAAKKK